MSATTSIYYWQDKNTKRQKFHISLENESKSLCGSYDFYSASQPKKTDTKPSHHQICSNCRRVMKTNTPENTRNRNVQKAKRIISDRLNPYQKTLNKTPEELMKNMEEIPQNIIELPTEITSEKESLNQIISTAGPVFSSIRKCASLNLDREIQNWKKESPDHSRDLKRLQNINKLKEIISAIDTIKSV